MLAHNSELNACLAGGYDHLRGCVEVGCDRLLHQHVLSRLGAEFNWQHPEIRQRANVNKVDAWVIAEFFDSADKFRANLLGELASTHWIPIRASHDFIADVFIRLDVFLGDCACTQDTYLHFLNSRSEERRVG